ncbi:MAG: tetratricopeptide repeat protein [Candidatus Latescibacterota bacterium]
MRTLCCLLCAAVCGCQSTALTSAKLYLQERKPAQAEEQLKQALGTEPANAEIHYLLGRAHAAQGEYPEMDRALDRSLELGSRFAEDIALLRRQYWAQEYNRAVGLATAAEPDYQAAREGFRTAVLIDSSQVQGWRNLAFTDYQLGDHEAALSAYEQIVRLAPADTMALSNLGALYIQQQRYAEASSTLEKLTQLHANDARAWVNLGIARAQLDSTDLAEAAYQQAVALDPEMALAYYGLGNLYWSQEEFAMARDQYTRAAELDPADQDIRFNLAMAHLQLGQDDQALPLLEALSQEAPDNGAVWRQLSLIYARQERMEESYHADARAKELGH